MAAEPKGAFSGAPGPNRAEIHADGRKNRDMENREETLRKFLRLLKLESDAAEAKVQDTGTAVALVTDDGVGIGTRHGDPFGFALNREGGLCNRCVGLSRQGACRSGRSDFKICRCLFGDASSRNGNG